MIDVNLNNSDSRLVPAGDKAPGRAMSSAQADGRNASAQSPVAGQVNAVSQSAEAQQISKAEKLENRNEIQREQLSDAVFQLNDFVQGIQRDLQFEVDDNLGETIVRVIDRSTREVIRQIPNEVAVRLAENLQQDEPLTLFNIKV
jgi:flagellar protein FlaG